MYTFVVCRQKEALKTIKLTVNWENIYLKKKISNLTMIVSSTKRTIQSCIVAGVTRKQNEIMELEENN